MKRSDLTAGNLYAHKRSQYDQEAPALLVDTETLWTNRKGQWERSRESTPGAKSYGYQTRDHGYLVVTGSAWQQADQILAALADVELPATLDELTVGELSTTLPEGLSLKVVNNRYLLGDWETLRAQLKKAHIADAERRAADDRKKAEGAARLKAANSGLEALGITGTAYRGGSGFYHSVTVPLETIEQLLALAARTAADGDGAS